MLHRPSAVLALILSLLLVLFASAHAAEVGEAVFAHGATTIQGDTGQLRVIGKGTPINQGDVLTTGRKSFVVMKFQDGTRMSLRPNTVFKVEQFSQVPQRESAVMRLFKGGIRAITGAISKRNPQAFRVNTAVATIGIRGTTFDARLCTDDCRAEDLEIAAGTPSAKVVARIGFRKGSVKARSDSHRWERTLALGAPLYEGDTLTTAAKSYAILVFLDKSRITLTANTEFRIETLNYDEHAPERGSAVFNLVRGGLRAVTGLLGRRNPRGVRFRTAVATIGIRGTGFDLFCQGECADPSAAAQTPTASPLAQLGQILVPTAYAAIAQGPGVYARVWSGRIVFELASGELFVDAGNVAFLPKGDGELVPLDELPFVVSEPRPDEVDIDEEALFGGAGPEDIVPGLYVSCYSGECDLITGDEVLRLRNGEAGRVDEEERVAVRLQAIPPFQSGDPYLQTVNEELQGIYDLLNDGIGDTPFECIVQ